jgi:hypothetical protein
VVVAFLLPDAQASAQATQSSGDCKGASTDLCSLTLLESVALVSVISIRPPSLDVSSLLIDIGSVLWVEVTEAHAWDAAFKSPISLVAKVLIGTVSEALGVDDKTSVAASHSDDPTTIKKLCHCIKY